MSLVALVMALVGLVMTLVALVMAVEVFISFFKKVILTSTS